MVRASFKTGFTYIVRDPKRSLWYLVQQVGVKSWVATNFTHIGLGYEDKIIKGNGGALYLMLDVIPTKGDSYFKTSDQRDLRIKMFNVLKFGRLDES